MDKNTVRPFYSELQGYLSQAPTPTPSSANVIYDESLWVQYNEAVQLFSKEAGVDYSRFMIEPKNSHE